MNWPGVLALVVTIYLLSALSKNQSGGALPGMAPPKPGEPYYGRQYRELDDVNAVLRRPVEKGKDNINTLQSYNENHEDNLHLKERVSTYLDFYDTQTKEVSKEELMAIVDKQPFIFDKAQIVYQSGQPFYYDARYPNSPIPVQFAIDPESFIRDHPNVYPSYVIRKGDLRSLGSYEGVSING